MVTYDLIGDDSAPSYFSLDSETGDIKVREEVNLPADTEITYMVSSCFSLTFIEWCRKYLLL